MQIKFFFNSLVLQAELEDFFLSFDRILHMPPLIHVTQCTEIKFFCKLSIRLSVSQGQGPYVVNIYIFKITTLSDIPKNIHWLGVLFLCFCIQTFKIINNNTDSKKELRIKIIPDIVHRKRVVEMECQVQAQVIWQVLPRGRLL